MMIYGFGLTAIILAAVMVVALIGMIACAKKQDVSPRAKPMAIVCMLIIIVCAIGILVNTGMFGDTSTKKLIANEMVYAKSAVIVPGKLLAEKYPDSKILLLIDGIANNVRQEELILAFKTALDGKLTIVGQECPRPLPFPPPDALAPKEGDTATPVPSTAPSSAPMEPMGMPEMMIPIQEVMTAQGINDILAKYPEVNMIVSFVGFPRDIQNMSIWYEENPEKKVKVVSLSGDCYNLKDAIICGQAVAAVVYSPNAKFSEKTAPIDPKAAFDERYILITPENIQEILTQFPNLFPEIKK
jgi:hypothetical protein